MSAFGVAIIGCGLIGNKRADALVQAELKICVDINLKKARALADRFPPAIACDKWHEVISRDDVQIVIVSTTNNHLAEITSACIKAGKHVLVEKPAACNLDDLRSVIERERESSALVRVGFNHRFHPSLRKAFDIVKEGGVGELMFLRGRYGHGGRYGYENEWRANPQMSGGGELIDQGVHLIDLARWFLGDFSEVNGFAHTYFWDMPVDDNAFMSLQTPAQQMAFLHVSCTEWKNLFSFEIYGKTGKLHIDGLGGSYGLERLAYYRMLPEMGPPETTIWEYPRSDPSWRNEFLAFIEDIRLQRKPQPGLSDAYEVLKIVKSIYTQSGYDNNA